MMTIVEKAAYLKGLTDGIGLEEGSKEARLWTALNDLLGDMAHEIEDLQSSNLDFAEAIDDISEDLSYLEELTCDLDRPEFPPECDDFDCIGECGGCCEDCGACYDPNEMAVIDPEGDEDDDDDLVYDGDEYDVTCPTCGAELVVSAEELEAGSINCPNCGETLEFDIDESDD